MTMRRRTFQNWCSSHISYMSYSLNSFKGVIQGIILWGIIGAIEGDTRSLDYSSYAPSRIMLRTGPIKNWTPVFFATHRTTFCRKNTGNLEVHRT